MAEATVVKFCTWVGHIKSHIHDTEDKSHFKRAWSGSRDPL